MPHVFQLEFVFDDWGQAEPGVACVLAYELVGEIPTPDLAHPFWVGRFINHKCFMFPFWVAL